MELVRLEQDINYDSIVRGIDLDLDTYNKKFEMWDYVIENNLLESPDLQIRAKATLLLEDPTIWTYAFFKNEEGKPFKFEAYQDAIANVSVKYKVRISDANDNNRYILFKAANQIGKTALEMFLIIYRAFTERNINIVLSTNRRELTSFILTNIRFMLNTSVFGEKWKDDVVSEDNATTIMLNFKENDTMYTNRIICVPAGEGALGYPVHYFFLDELDFYEDFTLFDRVFEPRTNKTKGQIIGFSNPNPNIGRHTSMLWKLWNGDLFRRKFHFKFLDASWNTQEEYDRKKKNSASHIAASTLDGEFPDEGGAFFKTHEVEDMLQKTWDCDKLPIVDRTVIIGLDIGKMNDNSVLTLGIAIEPKNPDELLKDVEVRYIEEFELGTEYFSVAKRLKEIQDYYNDNFYGHISGYDATGQKTFEEVLDNVGAVAEPVDFAKKESNKTKLYNDFKLMAEQRKIKIAYNHNMEKQLFGLELKQTSNKQLRKVENKNVTIHDDHPDSVAILIHVAQFPSYSEPSVVVIGYDKN